MQLRPYQQEAIDAVDAYFRAHDDNPCIVLPTGSGKTIVLAELIRRYLTAWPGTRICILVHVRELVRQNAEKLAEHWPEAPIGIYSASLNQRDTQAPVIFASIQSVYRRAKELGRFDLVFVDEAHRIPLKGDGQYRRFLADVATINPDIRVLGLTATPYRLGTGLVHGPDYILNSVAYEAPVRRLIGEGYLCRLTSKATQTAVDGEGVRVRGGEYVAGELEARVNDGDLVTRAVAEMVPRLADRKAWLVFCAGVAHAHSVSAELQHVHGIAAPVIHADTPALERARHIEAFARGELRALCNINVLSEGFDAPHVDAIVLLRPTMSAGLYYQQVGRGFRLHPDKRNCLVLDFAGNVKAHGPVDLIRVRSARKRGQSVTESVPCRECPDCNEYVPTWIRRCPECGYEWPIEKASPKHDDKPGEAEILSQPPQRVAVTDITYREHLGPSGIPTLRVDYQCGPLQRVSEWVCLEHTGYARAQADAWWAARAPMGLSVDNITDAITCADSLRTPGFIHVNFNERYPRIVRYEWNDVSDPERQTEDAQCVA